MSTDEMAAAHDRDYRVKGLYDDAARALDAVLEDVDVARWVTREERVYLEAARGVCQGRSAHIVAVWD